jgi:3-methyladenine DNA glycosylase AlkD
LSEPTRLERVVAAFEPARDDDRAGPMVAYLRDQFPFLGIPTPERRRLAKVALADLPPPSIDEVEAFARGCWDRPEREYQYVGADHTCRWIAVGDPSTIDLLRDLLTTKPWWDTVDALAANGVGSLVRAHPDLAAVMDRWIGDRDFWLARTAILHQLRWKADTDTDRLFGYCLRRAADTEFFLRKAIGWALREYSKTDPAAVERFVADHEGELSGLSKREALKVINRGRAARPRSRPRSRS